MTTIGHARTDTDGYDERGGLSTLVISDVIHIIRDATSPTSSLPHSQQTVAAPEPLPQTRDFYLPHRFHPLRTYYKAACEFGKERRDYIRRTIIVLGLVSGFIGIFALWPSVNAARDSHSAVILAEWDARKSYIEYCESHEWTSPGCEDIREKTPSPPPNITGSIWKRLLWCSIGSNDTNGYDTGLAMQEHDMPILLLLIIISVGAVLMILQKLAAKHALLRLSPASRDRGQAGYSELMTGIISPLTSIVIEPRSGTKAVAHTYDRPTLQVEESGLSFISTHSRDREELPTEHVQNGRRRRRVIVPKTSSQIELDWDSGASVGALFSREVTRMSSSTQEK